MPDNVLRKCIKCNEIKLLTDFVFKRKTQKGLLYRHTCKDCDNAHRRQKRKENPELYRTQEKCRRQSNRRTHIIRCKRHYELNKEYRLEYQRQYRAKNHDKTLGWARMYKDDLADSYVASLIVKNSTLSAKDIPPELIELKRQQLKIKREIRERNL